MLRCLVNFTLSRNVVGIVLSVFLEIGFKNGLETFPNCSCWSLKSFPLFCIYFSFSCYFVFVCLLFSFIFFFLFFKLPT